MNVDDSRKDVYNPQRLYLSPLGNQLTHIK